MKIKKSIHMKVAVLKISGNLMGPPDTETLFENVKSLLNEGFRRIILDLKHSRWINSQGIGALVRSYKLINEMDGKLILTRLSAKVRSVMTVSQLSRIFELRESLDEAINELNRIQFN
jgi:anti-sigma B factor antagonist